MLNIPWVFGNCAAQEPDEVRHKFSFGLRLQGTTHRVAAGWWSHSWHLNPDYKAAIHLKSSMTVSRGGFEMSQGSHPCYWWLHQLHQTQIHITGSYFKRGPFFPADVISRQVTLSGQRGGVRPCGQKLYIERGKGQAVHGDQAPGCLQWQEDRLLWKRRGLEQQQMLFYHQAWGKKCLHLFCFLFPLCDPDPTESISDNLFTSTLG